MAGSCDSFSTACDTAPDSCLGGSGRSSIDILDKCYIGGVVRVVMVVKVFGLRVVGL